MPGGLASLKQLSLNTNKIGDAGMTAFADAPGSQLHVYVCVYVYTCTCRVHVCNVYAKTSSDLR